MTGATGGAAMAGHGGAAVGGRGGGPVAEGGAAGGASGMGAGMKSSPGCGTATTQALNQWVESMVTVSGAPRPYSVRLPTGYNASRAYPVIVLLHGCGSGTNNVPMEKVTGTDAILVRGTGSAADTCWTTTANGADVAFFDAMVADTKARFCADENRFFVVGYSSGSWLANQLTCIRSSVLRGAASVTGGESAGSGCKGPVSRIFIHDLDDTTNVISGSEKARDRQLTQNGCDKSMQPVAQDPSPCVGYPGCPAAYPVVFCATSGQMHNRQDSFAPSTFWNFFKKF
jgi:poly(3-hydroxybutyrate) depolymerase